MTSVPIHHRKVIDTDGRILLEEVVDCPRDGRVRRLAACALCGYADALTTAEEDDEDLLECRVAAAATAPLKPRSGDPSTPFAGVTVADACVRDVICAVPDAPVTSVASALGEYAVGTVVIVDAGRAPLGVVSAQDILDLPVGSRLASDAMTHRPISVPFDYPLARAAALMAFEGIHHLPVIGPGGRLLGMLSSIDILRVIGLAEGMIVPPRTARRRHAEREDG